MNKQPAYNEQINLNGLESGLLKAVTDGLPANLYLQAEDYKIRYSNKYFNDHCNGTGNNICYEVIRGKTEPCEKCPTFEVFKTQEPQIWEWDDAPDGRVYHRVYDYPFTDTDGSSLVLEMGINITEQKNLENKFKESVTHYQNLFMNNHTIMLLIDPGTGKLIDANPAAADFYGYSIETFKKMKISDLNILPEGEVFDKMQAAKEKSRAHYIFKHKLCTGSIKDVEVYSGPVVIGGKTLLCSFIHDITEAVETEKTLKRVDKINHLLLTSISEGVYGIDTNGDAIFVNPAAEKMLGFTKTDLLGKNNHDLIHHTGHDGEKCPVKSCKMIRTAKDGEEHFVDDDILWRKDGTCFDVEYHSTPIFKNGFLSGAVVAFRDITKRKKIERERERLIYELHEALSKVKLLSGFIPICASCKKIRDDKGFWNQIESYIRAHSEAEFSHSICPDCAKELYPFLDLDLE